MEFLIVLLLIICNGLFAMAEIAIVSLRKSRLQKEVREGNKRAQAALELSENPAKFLSTVQIGITFIGIFAGAFGGETLAHPFSLTLKKIALIAPYSDQIAFFLVVVFITYLTLIIGELVPKRIALSQPEKTAKRIAGPMKVLASLAFPLVNLLIISSDFVIRLLRIKPPTEPSVSEEEVKLLLQEGRSAGIFSSEEQDIVERTFQMDEKKIITIMTPRKEIRWFDVQSSVKELRTMIGKHPHSYFPVCKGSLDKVVGVVRTEDILAAFLRDETIDFTKSLHKPLYVPESTEVWKVLELFKRTGIHMALVVDEYGSILGLISVADILEEIVGDIPDFDELDEKAVTKNSDGSYLVDGLLSVGEFKKYFKIVSLPEESSGAFHTLGGFVTDQLERIPFVDDSFEIEEFRLQVVEMDGNRVDKVLLTPLKKISQ
jgi:putative hemolysin